MRATHTGGTRPRHNNDMRAKHEGGVGCMAMDDGARGVGGVAVDRSMVVQKVHGSGGMMEVTVRVHGAHGAHGAQQWRHVGMMVAAHEAQWWRCVGYDSKSV